MDLAGRRKNATRETTATLKAWLYEHRKNPYPTKSEKVYLAIMTKMTLTQVSTWFANARRRLKKENKMTWSPRNRSDSPVRVHLTLVCPCRTTDDDDDRHGEQSNDSDSDEQSNSSAIPSSSATMPVALHYLSPPLTVLQHHQTGMCSSLADRLHSRPLEEKSVKRKLTEQRGHEPHKKRTGIWSLAEMAESNPHEKKPFCQSNDKSDEERRSSSSSSSRCSSQGLRLSFTAVNDVLSARLSFQVRFEP